MHLLRQRNVVATAVGRYLLRIGDDDARTFAERRREPPGRRPPRTLDQVEVTSRSWPCVIVFVDEWMSEDEIHDAPDEMVPRALYLPDGRVVPTCVVYARAEPGPEQAAPHSASRAACSVAATRASARCRAATAPARSAAS